MKVTLINPPFLARDSVGETKSIASVLNVVAPLGIAYIASVLRENGYKARIIDCTLGVSHKDLLGILLTESPDIIGISATTPTFENAKKIASSIRGILPKAKIVLGGCHVTALPEEALSDGCFDIGIIGEGEETFLELVQKIEKRGLSCLEDICGIAYRNNGSVFVSKRRPPIKDLNTLPFPARELLPELSKYSPTPASYRRLPLATLMTSRGCPMQCKFCDRSIFGSGYRQREPENILDEIEELVYRFSIKEIRFFDDAFTFDKERIFKLCEGFKRRGLKVSWTCLTTVTAVSERLLKAMRKAGCWQVLYGLESGDNQMLEILGKGNTLQQNRSAVYLAKQTGLGVRGDFLVGAPGETKESLNNTLNFAKGLPLDYAHFNKFVPYPGTEFYKMLIKQGFRFNFSKCCSITSHSAVIYTPEGISREEFKKFLDRAHREFYLRPRHILKRLVSTRTLAELRGQIHGFFAIYNLRD